MTISALKFDVVKLLPLWDHQVLGKTTLLRLIGGQLSALIKRSFAG